MAVQYTKKKEEKDEKTMNVSEFVERMVASKRIPDRAVEKPKTESPR